VATSGRRHHQAHRNEITDETGISHSIGAANGGLPCTATAPTRASTLFTWWSRSAISNGLGSTPLGKQRSENICAHRKHQATVAPLVGDAESFAATNRSMVQWPADRRHCR
jgi:hypothetical protein